MLFETATQFSLHIEELAKKDPDASYLDIILEFCDDVGVDYDEVAKLISPTLKEKIYQQSKQTYSLPKTTTYTLDDE